MSRYLTNLVRRTLDVAGTVRPRLPSPFESLPGAYPLGAGPADLREELVETVEGAPPVRAADPEDRAEALPPAAARRVRGRRGPPAMLPSEPASPATVAAEPAAVTSADPAADLPLVTVDADHPVVATDPPAAPVARPARPRPVVAAVRAGSPPAGHLAAAPPPDASSPPRLPEPVALRSPTLVVPRGVRAVDGSTTASGARPPSGDPAAPDWRPPGQPEAAGTTDPVSARSMPRRGGPGDEPRPADRPTVHVTIGRVEVRATTAAAAKPRGRAAPRPEPADLDAYLRRRSRGGAAT